MTTHLSNIKALVPYNPKLPHVLAKSHVDHAADNTFRRCLEITKKETQLLSPLSREWKERITYGVAQGAKYLYIDREIGAKMAKIVLRHFHGGDYDASVGNPLIFTQAIIKDLDSIYFDPHLGLNCSLIPSPAHDPYRSLRTLEAKELSLEQRAYEVSLRKNQTADFLNHLKAVILPNTQIGYFKINAFPSLEFYPEARDILANAFQNIVGAKALIIDLRENHGGDPAAVAFLASHLFDQRALLNQTYRSSTDTWTSFYVEPEQIEHHFGSQKPIYVLTSPQTFSAGEELAYDLQASKRAKIIGQVTGGGAHPVRPFILDDHVTFTVPFEKAINPHTQTNWEGKGVQPDYLLSQEEDALNVALNLLQKSSEQL